MLLCANIQATNFGIFVMICSLSCREKFTALIIGVILWNCKATHVHFSDVQKAKTSAGDIVVFTSV